MSAIDAADIAGPDGDADALLACLGKAARAAGTALGGASTEAKNTALLAAAAEIRAHAGDVLEANATDMRAARDSGLGAARLDRLALDETRIEGIARGLEEVVDLADPVGDVIAEWTRPNGLRISRVRVPLGVIGIIYESRPNVTADAGALSLKSGNAAILRGGSESHCSSPRHPRVPAPGTGRRRSARDRHPARSDERPRRGRGAPASPRLRRHHRGRAAGDL